MPKITILVALGCAFGIAASAAHAQTSGRLYRYVDDKGKVHYLDRPPTEAAGRPLDQLNRQGATIKPGEVPLTPEQVAAREAEKRRMQEDQIKQREENRKNQALLDTYSTVDDIEAARVRALAVANDAIKDSNARLAEALKRQEKLKAEAEFYQKKSMPPQLKQEMQNNEREVALQREAIDRKEKEISALNAKFDDDKRRYLEIAKPAPKIGATAVSQTMSSAPSVVSKR